MANNGDQDQTAPKEQSDLGLHCLFILFCPGFKGFHGIMFHKEIVNCSEILEKTD